MSRGSHAIDRVRVSFDDPNLVANSGMLLIGTLVMRLELARSTPRSGWEGGGRLPAGAQGAHARARWWRAPSHIDHADVLRSGNTAGVLPHRVMAP